MTTNWPCLSNSLSSKCFSLFVFSFILIHKKMTHYKILSRSCVIFFPSCRFLDYLKPFQHSGNVGNANKPSVVSSCSRYPSLQMWAVWESLHTAVLFGVPHEKDSWCSPTVCLPPEALQDICVWGLWLHLKSPWWVFPPHETVPPWQSCPPQVLPPPGPW